MFRKKCVPAPGGVISGEQLTSDKIPVASESGPHLKFNTSFFLLSMHDLDFLWPSRAGRDSLLQYFMSRALQRLAQLMNSVGSLYVSESDSGIWTDWAYTSSPSREVWTRVAVTILGPRYGTAEVERLCYKYIRVRSNSSCMSPASTP